MWDIVLMADGRPGPAHAILVGLPVGTERLHLFSFLNILFPAHPEVSCEPLGQAENLTFRIRLDGQVLLLRLSPRHRYLPSERETERELVLHLSQTVPFLVQKPVPFPAGQWSCALDLPAGPHVASLWSFLDGTFAEHPTLIQLQQVGVATAQMHQQAAAFLEQHPAPRPAFRVPHLDHIAALLPPECPAEVLQPHLDAFARLSTRTTLLHGDLHQGNCLFQEDRVGFIDFDDCQHGPVLMEWAATLAHQSHRSDFAGVQQAFLSGYLGVLPGLQAEVQHVPLALLVRRVWLLDWAQQRRNTPYLQDFVEGYLHHHLQELQKDLQRLQP